MSKHTKQRVNDQYHCSCGLQWDVDEDDPHIPAGKYMNAINKSTAGWTTKPNRNIGNKALTAIKENLNRE